MARIAYHVVLPFSRGEDGELAAGEAMEVPTPGAAIRRAIRVAEAQGGAVAFSRTGDAATGDYEPAVILGRYGEVPDDLAEHTG